MWTETELAYLAGIIDGEGTVTIESRKGPKGNEERKYLRPLVHVVNTNLVLLDWIQARFGGYLYGQPVGKASDRAKDCFRLSWSSQHAERLLLAVRPYLVVKAVQADVVLRFYDSGRWIGHALPTEVHEARAELVASVRALNKKGRG